MRSDNTQKITAKIEKRPFSKLKRSNFVSLRGRSAAVAIFKPKAWHPAPKHGSTEQKEIPITKNMDSPLIPLSLFLPRLCFVPPYHISFRDGKSIR